MGPRSRRSPSPAPSCASSTPDQSLNADELSTRWIVAGNDPWGVLSMVHTDAEITPPLYFEAAWLTSRVELAAGWLRAPSLIAGVAAIPLVYAIGLRHGRPQRCARRRRARRARAVHDLLLGGGARVRADDRARDGSDAVDAGGARRRAGALVGRLRGLLLRRDVHPLHERVRARGPTRVAARVPSGGAPPGAARQRRRGARVPAVARRVARATWTRARRRSSRRCSRSTCTRSTSASRTGSSATRTRARAPGCATCPAGRR